MDEDKQQPAPPPAGLPTPGADDTKPAQATTAPAGEPPRKKQPALPPPKSKSKPLALKARSAPSKPATAAGKPVAPQSSPAPHPADSAGEPTQPPAPPKPKVQLPKSPFAATQAAPSPPAPGDAPAAKKKIPVKYITSGVMVLAVIVLFVMSQTKKSRKAPVAPQAVAAQQPAPPKKVKPAAAQREERAPSAPMKTAAAAPDDEAAGQKPWVIEDLKLTLRWIPEGKALLGTAEDERSELRGRLPQGEAHVLNYESEKESDIPHGYWLGETEVTIGQWKAFIAANPDFKTSAELKGSAHAVRENGAIATVKGADWRNPLPGEKVTDRHPVTCIRPPEAESFCDWLTKRERDAGRLPAGMAFRLPTETEWVNACRGGAKMRSAYWWGSDPSSGEGCLNAAGAEFTAHYPATERFNFSWSDPYVHLAPADAFGKKGRNYYDMADMLGNVWECVTQPLQTKYRYAWCGGSFAEGPGICRCASSRHRYTDNPSATAGFRVCLAPE